MVRRSVTPGTSAAPARCGRGLGSGSLVNARHHRRIRRVETQPDDVEDLVDELRVHVAAQFVAGRVLPGEGHLRYEALAATRSRPAGLPRHIRSERRSRGAIGLCRCWHGHQRRLSSWRLTRSHRGYAFSNALGYVLQVTTLQPTTGASCYVARPGPGRPPRPGRG
jgi:hypothetical protein